jgi:microsomal dipeptidase-like Zn-dependent dipeptidase
VVCRGAQARAIGALAVALVLVAPASAASQTPTRYSLAGGCHGLRSAPSGQTVPGAERLRMQATTLGSYLLYRPDGMVLAVQEGGSVTPEAKASPAADWRVADAGAGTFTLSPASDPDRLLTFGPDGRLTVAASAAAGPAARFSFPAADGCAVYPEAELGANGTPSRGETPYGAVGGFLEGHMHWMTFEYLGGDFHCGRPWHPYGIPYALPDCSEVEGPQGAAAPTQNVLNYGQPAAPHDTTGWPKLTEWGAHNVTYEGTYWRWIQRAWLGGLRLMVMSVNENRVLCELQARRRNSCDEMSTVRKGFEDIRELQRYVDAQAGGPGKGFFEIVTTPYEARRVINQGRMAVVLEIEVSELFGCRGWETSTCDRARIDRELDEFYRLGVRSSLLLNKFDNPLTGVRFDSGPVGTLINAGNRQSAGSFWSAETCTGPYHDNTIDQPSPQGSAFLDSTLGALGVTSGTMPSYPPAPHCNTRGLTELGRYLERRMIEKHMIINPDHMSQRAVDDTLTLAEAHRYSGVISPHGWMDPGNWPRIWKLGGLAFPDSDTSTGFLKAYEKYRPARTPYRLGWGYGADLGGLAAQPDPRPGNPQDGVSYPFKSYDGKVTFERQRTGERVFDYAKEGVAHYGLYADWFEDLRLLDGAKLARDMWNGAEAYLEMWERADGVPVPGCRTSRGRVTARGLRQLRLRRNWETLLRRAGQPQQRTRAWSWCVRGARNRRAADVAELSPGGRVELVGSTARGRSAGGIAVGARARHLRGVARSAGSGMFVRRARRSAYVFAVRRGRVRAVGVATRALARRPARLRAAMRRLRKARATQAARTFTPNPTAGSARLTGTTLAGSSNPRLNRALALLCSVKP